MNKKHKQSLDRILINLHKYFSTPEGEDFSNRLNNLMEQIEIDKVQRLSPVVVLSGQEKRVLTFVKRELKQGRAPSVRAIAQSLGFSSSRSGSRIINALIEKRVLERDEKGRIRVVK